MPSGDGAFKRALLRSRARTAGDARSTALDPSDSVARMATPRDTDETPQRSPLELLPSPGFVSWLEEIGASLAFTTYQTNRLFLIGLTPERRLSVFERFFDWPMGMYATPQRLYMSSRFLVWRFENALPEGEFRNGYDRLFVPRHAHTTGALDVHDLAPTADGRVVFANTAYSCLAVLSERYSFAPLWRPPFISCLAYEDRCHLNGLAMADGAPAYVTTVSTTDTREGWRERRRDGGCVLAVPTGDVVARGLSMPHSPRLYRERLWVLNSGSGELGWVDRRRGEFEPTAFCPGFLRGLALTDHYAIVGLSRLRPGRTFSGLPLDDALRARGEEARCGLWVVDLHRGAVVHSLEIRGVVAELYDVQLLPGVRRPMALGFQTDEIQRTIAIDAAPGPTLTVLDRK